MGIAYGTTTLHQATKGIVQDGLVLNLDAGVRDSYDSGTTWRDLKGGNNGTLTNGPTFDKANGGNIVFDGSNDRIVTTTNISLGSTFSAFFMLKFDGYDTVLAGGSGYASGGYILYVAGSSLMYFSPTNGFGTVNPGLSTNQWTHLGITRNGTSCTFYKNGTSLGTSSCGNGSLSIGAIGAYTGGTFPFNGSMSSFVVYNKELSAAEVLQNFNATRHRFGI